MSATIKAYGMGQMQPSEVIEDIGTTEVLIGGLKVSIHGSSGQREGVTIYVSPTEVTVPGGPQRLLSEIHNLNSLQAAMTFRPVDGDKYP